MKALIKLCRVLSIFFIFTQFLAYPASGALVNRYSFTSDASDSVGSASGALMNGATIVDGQAYCDGIDDYVDLPADVIDINSFPAITLDLWSRQPTIDQSYSMTAALGGKWNSAYGRDYVYIATTRGDEISRGAIANTPDQVSPWLDESYVSGPELNDNREHYYALTLDGTEISLYIDGELLDSASMNDDTIAGLSNDFAYLARSVYGQDDTVACLIDEFRIYNSALTARQIQQNYEWGPDKAPMSLVEISESDGSTSILDPEMAQDSYTVRLVASPSAPVLVKVDAPNDLDLGLGAGWSRYLVFTSENWDVPQTVTVKCSDYFDPSKETVRVKHTSFSEDKAFNDLNIYDVWVRLQSQEDSIYIDTAETLSTIDEKIYGHFLEHIYHSVNGGLWGDMIWNRSFEMINSSNGFWTTDNDEVFQNSLATNVTLRFGDTSWTDYEFTCQAKKIAGAEGFLLLCRADGNQYYWFNLGGWTNIRHALEKSNTSGNVSEVAGTSVYGNINTDQWYNIRVRCEGTRLKLWLDDSLLINYNDPSAYLHGRVGLGTWATRACYRNIEVRNLVGDLLYSGLPDLPQAPLADFWQRYGTGNIETVGSALNGDLCINIDNTSQEESGIQQDELCIIAQPYTGSFWSRGSGGTLYVRLMEGERLLQQLSLGAPLSDWSEYNFVLNPTLDPNEKVTNASLQIGLEGTGQVWIDQVSMMGEDANDTGGYRPDLLKAVEDLSPSVIRWPGGCFASAYFWKDAIGPQYSRTKYQINLWDDQETNAYGTDEFLRMCEKIGAEPVIVINTGVLNSTCGVSIPIKLTPEEYLQDALDWIEYCNGDPNTTTWGALRATNGHSEPYNVKYWEIDNETWGAGISAYIDEVLEFAPVMRAKDPNIQIIACGSSSYNQGWNRTLIDVCADEIDYISTHHYESASNFKNGPLQYEAFIEQLGDYIAQSANPNIKIFMSEWNAQTTDWRTGLYAGGLLNAFERTSDVFEMASPALFLRHLSATQWDNAFINFDQTGWFPAPNYVVMKLWRDHYAPNLLATTSSYKDLNVVSTCSADYQSVYCKLVNPDNEEMVVQLELDSSFVPGSASMEYVAPGSLGARNSLTATNVKVEKLDLNVSGQTIQCVLPSYSAAVVTIQPVPQQE